MANVFAQTAEEDVRDVNGGYIRDNEKSIFDEAFQGSQDGHRAGVNFGQRLKLRRLLQSLI